MSDTRLLHRLRDRAAVRRYSPRTTALYARWVVRFVRYHGMRHPATLGADGVRDFLTYLAHELGVAASTQNQAMAALQFLYRDVLEQPPSALAGVEPARKPHHLPKVLSREVARCVLEQMSGMTRLMAQLLYGSGLRLAECCQLRIKDVDADRGELRVRRGKGDRDRVTVLSQSLAAAMWSFRTLWSGRRRGRLSGRLSSRRGTGSFLRHGSIGIGKAGRAVRTIFTLPSCSGPSRRWRGAPRWNSGSGAIRSATRLLRTCSMPATTFEPYRNCSAIEMWRRRCSTRMC